MGSNPLAPTIEAHERLGGEASEEEASQDYTANDRTHYVPPFPCLRQGGDNPGQTES